MMKGTVKDSDLILKGTDKLLKENNTVTFSFFIPHSKCKEGEIMGDKRRWEETGSITIAPVVQEERRWWLGLGLELKMERVERFKIFKGVKQRKWGN